MRKSTKKHTYQQQSKTKEIMQLLNKSNTTFIYKTMNLHIKQENRIPYTTYLFTKHQENNKIAQRSGL